MGRKLITGNKLIDKETIGSTVALILLLWIVRILWKQYNRLRKKEPYDKQKTIMKYVPGNDGIQRIRDISGLGLTVVQFIFDDYPGFCCSLCGPIFHITLFEDDDEHITCNCSLCSKELSSEESKHVVSFMNEVFARKSFGNVLVMCPNSTGGCNVVHPVKELKEHVRHCPYTKLPCPRACGITVERQNMEHHIKFCKTNAIAHQQVQPPYPVGAAENNTIPVPSCPPPPYESNIGFKGFSC